MGNQDGSAGGKAYTQAQLDEKIHRIINEVDLNRDELTQARKYAVRTEVEGIIGFWCKAIGITSVGALLVTIGAGVYFIFGSLPEHAFDLASNKIQMQFEKRFQAIDAQASAAQKKLELAEADVEKQHTRLATLEDKGQGLSRELDDLGLQRDKAKAAIDEFYSSDISAAAATVQSLKELQAEIDKSKDAKAILESFRDMAEKGSSVFTAGRFRPSAKLADWKAHDGSVVDTLIQKGTTAFPASVRFGGNPEVLLSVASAAIDPDQKLAGYEVKVLSVTPTGFTWQLEIYSKPKASTLDWVISYIAIGRPAAATGVLAPPPTTGQAPAASGPDRAPGTKPKP